MTPGTAEDERRLWHGLLTDGAKALRVGGLLEAATMLDTLLEVDLGERGPLAAPAPAVDWCSEELCVRPTHPHEPDQHRRNYSGIGRG